MCVCVCVCVCVCERGFVVVVIFVFNVIHFENCFLFKVKDSKLILWTREEFAESKNEMY